MVDVIICHTDLFCPFQSNIVSSIEPKVLRRGRREDQGEVDIK